jgi:hypothetical protein
MLPHSYFNKHFTWIPFTKGEVNLRLLPLQIVIGASFSIPKDIAIIAYY